jgi:hypothetical protein
LFTVESENGSGYCPRGHVSSAKDGPVRRQEIFRVIFVAVHSALKRADHVRYTWVSNQQRSSSNCSVGGTNLRVINERYFVVGHRRQVLETFRATLFEIRQHCEILVCARFIYEELFVSFPTSGIIILVAIVVSEVGVSISFYINQFEGGSVERPQST